MISEPHRQKKNHQIEIMAQHFLDHFQAKILDHDNVNYLKKILGELAMVLDQVEAELEKKKLEYQGTSDRWPLRCRHDLLLTAPSSCRSEVRAVALWT